MCQKRIIIFVILVPLVTKAITKNNSQWLQEKQAPRRVDIITQDDDQSGQEKSGRVNIENNKSAVDACQSVICGGTQISERQLGSQSVCIYVCVIMQTHLGVFINKGNIRSRLQIALCFLSRSAPVFLLLMHDLLLLPLFSCFCFISCKSLSSSIFTFNVLDFFFSDFVFSTLSQSSAQLLHGMFLLNALITAGLLFAPFSTATMFVSVCLHLCVF